MTRPITFKSTLLYCCSLVGILSCTKELDIALPAAQPQLVLNGILHPDSTIRVSLTTTLPPNPPSTDFPVVNNATIRLYEDEQLVGNLLFQDSLYTLDYHPKAGSEYTIEAEVPGYKMVSATDQMPRLLNAQACVSKNPPTTGFSYLWFEVTVEDHPEEANFYWLDLTVTKYPYRRCRYIGDEMICPGPDSATIQTEKPFHLHSFSTVPDKFNATVDNTSGGVTDYDGYIRIDDTALNGESIALSMTSNSDPMFQQSWLGHLDENQYVEIQILNASQHYDRYLKLSWMYFLDNDYFYEPNPFSETTQIYSNVKNGTGIFAAYNSAHIRATQNQCE